VSSWCLGDVEQAQHGLLEALERGGAFPEAIQVELVNQFDLMHRFLAGHAVFAGMSGNSWQVDSWSLRNSDSNSLTIRANSTGWRL
jgi:hypothetical protein